MRWLQAGERRCVGGKIHCQTVVLHEKIARMGNGFVERRSVAENHHTGTGIGTRHGDTFARQYCNLGNAHSGVGSCFKHFAESVEGFHN